MHDYGLSPDELIAKDFRRIQSSRRGYQPYGKRGWVAAIKKVYERNGKIFTKYLQKRHPYLYAQGTWLFGDWDKALSAAGFDPERMRLRLPADEAKIMKGIRTLRNHFKLFHGALAVFGSWNRALVAAGVTAIPRKTRLGLLREQRDALEARSDIPHELRLEIAYYFGSLRNAKIALQTDAKLLSGWSKRKIVTTLSQDAVVQVPERTA
jgi:hypothetical protein